MNDKVTVSVLRQEGTVAHPQPFGSHSGSGEGRAQSTAIGRGEWREQVCSDRHLPKSYPRCSWKGREFLGREGEQKNLEGV